MKVGLTITRLLVLCGTLQLAACGYFFPGFEGPFGIHSYIHDVPVSRIATELQCELRDFLSEPQNADVLDPQQAAGVTVSLQSDQSGTFQYIGIDLKKVGLEPVASVISATSKTPSLQAKIQAKGAVSSQIDMSIPQTIKTIKVKPKHVVDPDTGGIVLSKPAIIKGLASINCDPSRGLLAPLSLSSWLNKFFAKMAKSHDNTEPVCMTKVTLKTSFVFLFDISAGVNPLIGTAFILPVSGESFDFSPSVTQSLQIALALKRYNDRDLCTKIPETQPHRVINS